VRLRAQNKTISITLSADNKQTFNEFTISYKEIHCEGYEDWFDFGDSVQLLIRIEFRVCSEPNVNQTNVSKFHLNTIIVMIGKIIDDYRDSVSIGSTGHRTASHRTKISYIRKRVARKEEAFWSTQTKSIDFTQSIRKLSSDSASDRIRAQTIKYCDLQIPYEFHDSYEDTVCLCSQWCNWNSFFYYNPIYRFLLVQHNRLYLKNRTNIPDMYLFATTAAAYIAKNSIPFPKTPVSN